MRFQYQALQQDGTLVVGQIEAPSARGAHRDLLKRGMQPTRISVAGVRARATRRRTKKAKHHDLTYVLKELHSLVIGGVPIAEAVTALRDATQHPALIAAYSELNADLRHGEKFSKAFQRCFPKFPSYIYRIIESGELTGRLGAALADAAEEMEHTAKVRTELRNALVYPAFLVGFGILAVLFIFMVVVPRFAIMFKGKFDKLPMISYVVIVFGMWVRNHLLLWGMLVAGLVVAGIYAFRQPKIRGLALALLSRTPVLRHWLTEFETARWSAVLARLLENRVPLMQSLELARSTLKSEEVQRRLVQVERSVRGGGALTAALDDNRVLPATALTLVRVGERSGNLPEMVRNVAAIYDEIIRNRIKVMLSIIEPVAILLIGAAVGVLAVAIFLAITSINDITGM